MPTYICDVCKKSKETEILVFANRWLKLCDTCLDGAVKFLILGADKFRSQDA